MNEIKKKNEVATKEARNTALTELARRLSVDTPTLQKTLMETAFKECKTNEQFIAAVIVANTYKLNPILKEMYVFPSKSGSIIPIVSIDGWISLVNRNPDFDGVELIENEDDQGNLKSVTAKFRLKKKANPVAVTEYMAECCDNSKEPWKRWPRRMLRHKAYIQGARIAFGLSGIYDEDEAMRITEAQMLDSMPISTIGKPIVEEPKPKNPEKQDLDSWDAHEEELKNASRP